MRISDWSSDVCSSDLAMPSDPRGTSPGIRAASFQAQDGQLDYQILLMQDEGKTDTLPGQAELNVAGRYANGKSGHIEIGRASCREKSVSERVDLGGSRICKTKN